MKKIFLFAMMAVLSLGALTSCEDDYEDATSVHQYSETENPPLKGSDATNLVSSSVKMRQAEAGTEVITVDLNNYATKIQEELGMSLDDAISGISSGSVRFLPVNPNRRMWDKTPANAGENTWTMSASGVVTSDTASAVIKMEFVPSAKQVKLTLTSKAQAGIIPVTYGFVKTDDSAYSTNIRIQNSVNVVDASVADVSVTVPTGGYATALMPFSSIAKNIEYAFGETDIQNFGKGLDTDNQVYDAYIMGSDGSLSGGPDNYTSNGAGFWLNADNQIVTWGKDNYCYFLEPLLQDENGYLSADAMGINVGRLSSDSPASGTVINVSEVIRKHSYVTGDKTLTINYTITFE